MEALRTVGEEMTEPVLVDRASTIQDASAAMLDGGVETAIVIEDGEINGVVTAEGVARALARGYDTAVMPVGRICDPAPLLARPDEAVVEVHQRMRAQDAHIAVAVGPHREPMGVLTDPDKPLAA